MLSVLLDDYTYIKQPNFAHTCKAEPKFTHTLTNANIYTHRLKIHLSVELNTFFYTFISKREREREREREKGKNSNSGNTCVHVRWLVGWILWHINPSRSFNAKSIFIQINNSILSNSVKSKYTVQLSKIFLFQAI